MIAPTLARACKPWYDIPMAYIPYLEYADASTEAQELYDKFRNLDGTVDNILRIHAAKPKSWAGHYDLYASIMRGPSELSRAQREMIGVVVSAINECHY